MIIPIKQSTKIKMLTKNILGTERNCFYDDVVPFEHYPKAVMIKRSESFLAVKDRMSQSFFLQN